MKASTEGGDRDPLTAQTWAIAMDAKLRGEEEANVAKALAHPLRVEMLFALREESPISAIEFARYFDEHPPNCSYHLRSLQAQGLVEVATKTKRGGAVEQGYAPVDGDIWRAVVDALDAIAASRDLSRKPR